jgi:hypothetical protein
MLYYVHVGTHFGRTRRALESAAGQPPMRYSHEERLVEFAPLPEATQAAVETVAADLGLTPVISAYTRRQAIEDGELVPIPSDWCDQYGVRFSMCFTRSLWGLIERIPASRQGIESERGRALDVIAVLALTLRAHVARGWNSDRINFRVIITHVEGGHMKRNVDLHAECGPGDHAEPVITIGFADDF